VQGQRTTLRDNLQSIAIAVLLVLAVRQFVVEAFKIPTGSMAPTLLGVHKEVRCPNCGWVFTVGHNDVTGEGLVACPNCGYRWDGASSYYEDEFCAARFRFKRPAWLWHQGYSRRCNAQIVGSDAANRVLRGGSRIFVNKFIYRFRKPRRWEVIVFLYPFYKVHCKDCGWSGDAESVEGFRCPECGSENLECERRNFIKRLVGLPGENISILNGDVYVNGRIARKPLPIQERLWMHVFDSRFVPRQEVYPLWDFGRDSRLWTRLPDGGLLLNATGSGETVMAALARKVRASCAYNSSRELLMAGGHGSEANEVGDCRLAATVKLLDCREPERATVVLRIVEDERDFTVSFPVGKGRSVVVRDGSDVLTEVPVVGLAPGKPVRLVLENYDDRLVVKLRGATLFSYDYDGNPSPSTRRKSIQLGARGCKVLFQNVLVQRDIYYLGRNEDAAVPRVCSLGEKQYFVLGDNSPQSSDSRFWPRPYLPEDNIIGQAIFVFWPVHHFRFLSFGAQDRQPCR